MKVYLYSRVSTDSQELTQQRHNVQEFLDSRGWRICKEVFDEDVSGYKVSYKDRGLARLLDEMQEGDCLICSELSRLGRKMCDINRLINDDLKPRKLRLVIVSMGIDLDCSKMKAIDELILQNFAFAAQVEVEMTRERVKSALAAIKDELGETGSHVSKSGNVIKRLGNPNGWSKDASSASAEARRARAKENPHNQRFVAYVRLYESRVGRITPKTDITPLTQELSALGYKTSSGLDFTNNQRTRAMLASMRKIFAA